MRKKEIRTRNFHVHNQRGMRVRRLFTALRPEIRLPNPASGYDLNRERE